MVFEKLRESKMMGRRRWGEMGRKECSPAASTHLSSFTSSTQISRAATPSTLHPASFQFEHIASPPSFRVRPWFVHQYYIGIANCVIPSWPRHERAPNPQSTAKQPPLSTSSSSIESITSTPCPITASRPHPVVVDQLAAQTPFVQHPPFLRHFRNI